jgi:hypothetical protein
VHALVDGHDATAEEEHQGDKEAPEIRLAAVPHGVRLGGRPLRLAVTEEEENLIGAVGERVQRLGEHRA